MRVMGDSIQGELSRLDSKNFPVQSQNFVSSSWNWLVLAGGLEIQRVSFVK